MGVLSLDDARRNVKRAIVNEMDKSTVFSIYPKLIDEKHHTIQPGRFIIQPGTPKNPTRLVVSSSSWFRELDVNVPFVEIVSGSVQVADAIVKGYCNGLFGCDMANAMPGLFWAMGNLAVKDLYIKDDLMALMEAAKNKQNNYFDNLIKMTDVLWTRTNGNPLVVSDDARLAARERGVEKLKDWMNNFTAVEKVRCINCGEMRNPLYPTCSHCHQIIDIDLYNKLGIAKPKDANNSQLNGTNSN